MSAAWAGAKTPNELAASSAAQTSLTGRISMKSPPKAGPIAPANQLYLHCNFAHRGALRQAIQGLKLANAPSGPAGRKGRRPVGGHGRGRPIEALDLDQTGLGDAALAQFRRSNIEGKRVGIAVLLQGPVGAGIGRIEPGAGR